MTEAWFFGLCVLLAAVEVARPLTLIIYGALLMVRSLRGLARLSHEPAPPRPGRSPGRPARLRSNDG